MNIKKKAWVLRTCNANGTSTDGFKWPSRVGAKVKCEDWDAKSKCGNGLHGLLDGWGNYGLLSDNIDALWQIVEVNRTECVEIGRKVKFPKCKIVYCGDMATALTKISDYQIKILLDNSDLSDNSQLSASGEYSKLAASGNSSKLAASGNSSKLAAAGNSSKLAAAGNSSKLSASGEYSQLSASGEYSQLSASGEYSQLSASGEYSQLAAAGDGSQLAAAGNSSRLAAAGNSSKLAAAGNSSKLAAAGYDSQLAASGQKSIAICAGLNSIASAGDDGCIALTYFDDSEKRYRVKVGYIGEDNLKPNVYYSLDDSHEFVEVGK